jgi:hypothetical protein
MPVLSLATHTPNTDPGPHLAALCASLLLRPWLGLCCPLLINSHSIKQSHGPPYLNDERGADSSLSLSRHSSTQCQSCLLPVTAARPASESFASFSVLGGCKFRELGLSWCPPPPKLAFIRDCPTPKVTTRAASKTSSVSTDWNFMPSIALWSPRFGRLAHYEYVFPSTP